ncbi:MAG: hypothetical protein IPM92_05625 [Saprospiraceae bacterium]|nr:hypothetical protein [Saprospiraceae bacterium]
MKKIKVFHLTHCGTCKKILNSFDTSVCSLQDIKETKIKADELDKMAKLIGSYEALFSRKAVKYQTMGLKDKVLTEKDYRKLILEDYTFLKRPVMWSGKTVLAGHTKEAIQGMIDLVNAT